jgi:hypothetical protein
VLFSLFGNSGMFHSDDERNRNVDPYNESHTSTTTDKRNTTYKFELDQFTSCEFDTFGFDLDCYFGGRGDTYMSSQGSSNSANVWFDESKHSTSFSPEEKWPI